MVAKLKFDRKKRYVLQTVLSFVLAYFVFFKLQPPLFIEVLIILVFTFVSSILSHYPNLKVNNLLFGLILPFQLLLAEALFLKFFPNLSEIFKLFSVLGFTFLYYVVSLVDNIFLVVQDREEQIPLYRVAITWSQILAVVIAIPLLSSLFKFNINGVWQSLMAAISAVLFCIYQLWGLTFDKETKNPKVGEFIQLVFLVGFLVFAAAISVSFIPTESFLRSLYVSSVLMFGLNYVYSHLKNDISEKSLVQHAFISVVFFIILLIFIP